MKTIAMTVCLCAVGAVSCGAKVVVDSAETATGGSPGSPGSGGLSGQGGLAGAGAPSTSNTTSNTTSSGTMASGTASGNPSMATGTGTSSGDGCVPQCSAAVTTGIGPCDGLPFALYGQLVGCACGGGGGLFVDGGVSCSTVCETNLCKLKIASDECLQCAAAGCTAFYNSCFAQ